MLYYIPEFQPDFQEESQLFFWQVEQPARGLPFILLPEPILPDISEELHPHCENEIGALL